jgi:hypothetical protein
MIWRYIYPVEGGGSVRRIIQFKRAMAHRRLEGVKLTESPAERLKPLALFDFSRHDDAVDARNRASGWRYSDDETIGGLSAGKLSFFPSPRSDVEKTSDDDEKRVKLHTVVEEGLTTEKSNMEEQDDIIPFLRFEGITDTTLPKASKKVVRSGFCAIRSPEFVWGGADIGQYYNALEIKCRLDARIYTFNLKVRTFFYDDLYQSFITRPSGSTEDWQTLILPFNDFILTAFGRIREIQRKLDGGIIIENMGITVADGKDGNVTRIFELLFFTLRKCLSFCA